MLFLFLFINYAIYVFSRDVVLYFLFLILISFIAWGTKSQKPFFMNREIHQLFDGRSGRNETLKVRCFPMLPLIPTSIHSS